MFKVNNKDTRSRSGVFIVNCEHISHLVLLFLLLLVLLNSAKKNSLITAVVELHLYIKILYRFRKVYKEAFLHRYSYFSKVEKKNLSF